MGKKQQMVKVTIEMERREYERLRELAEQDLRSVPNEARYIIRKAMALWQSGTLRPYVLN